MNHLGWLGYTSSRFKSDLCLQKNKEKPLNKDYLLFFLGLTNLVEILQVTQQPNQFMVACS